MVDCAKVKQLSGIVSDASFSDAILIFEPRCEKTGLRGFRPGPTQTGQYIHRRWLEP